MKFVGCKGDDSALGTDAGVITLVVIAPSFAESSEA